MVEITQLELGLGENAEHESRKVAGKLAIPSSGRVGKGTHATLVFLLLVAAFYFSGIATVVSLKKLMRTHPFPFLWCSVQFVFAFVLSKGYVRLNDPSTALLPSIPTYGPGAIASMCNALGFIVTNVALKYVSAPFMETARAIECITTVLMGAYYLRERPSLMSLLTLAPICGGVYISCRQTVSFSATGFFWLMLCNLAFSGRSVGTRLLQQSAATAVDPVKFFADMCAVALCLLIPITAILEGGDIYRCVFGDACAGQETYALFQVTDFSVPQLSFVMTVVWNGLTFAANNALSVVILHRTDLLTHSVVNVFRRVVTIFVTSAYLGIELNAANITGVLVSLGGVAAYSYLKFSERPSGST